MKKKVTVTIGREYGSGGREVGEKPVSYTHLRAHET